VEGLKVLRSTESEDSLAIGDKAMQRLILCCALLTMALGSPALAQQIYIVGPGGLSGTQQTYCDDPDIKDLVFPDGVVGLAASECFGGLGQVLQTEKFIGDGDALIGVGVWFTMLGGLPDVPKLVVRIYVKDSDGCPSDTPVYECYADIVDVGPGSGSVEDPIEYYVDFAANGCPQFAKEEGVVYQISVSNNNCPGEGNDAFWGSGVGDGLFGCIIAPDFGIPDWTPKADAGFPWDNAMYLCNKPAATATTQSTWGSIKALYQ
jgi:hypothetical protein